MELDRNQEGNYFRFIFFFRLYLSQFFISEPGLGVSHPLEDIFNEVYLYPTVDQGNRKSERTQSLRSMELHMEGNVGGAVDSVATCKAYLYTIYIKGIGNKIGIKRGNRK
jgi:hypothetical protein